MVRLSCIWSEVYGWIVCSKIHIYMIYILLCSDVCPQV